MIPALGPPFFGEQMSAYYLCANRTKRAFALDLGKAEGLQLFHELIDKSDVLIENFRTDSAERMGLAPKALLPRHRRLVACSITGFGHTGPMRDEPGYDLAIQALSGLMSVTGPPEGPPCKVGVAMADILTGMYAAVGILAALRARERSGHGYHIDLALLDCAIAAQINLAQAYLLTGNVPPRPGNTHFQIVPYAVFAAKDGWLALNVGNDSQWHRCRGRGLELASDPLTTNPLRCGTARICFPLNTLFETRTVSDWRVARESSRAARSGGRLCVRGRQRTGSRSWIGESDDPDGKPVDLIGSPFHMTGANLAAPAFPPRVGEHTDAVLKEFLGLDADRLGKLREGGVIA